MLAGLTSDTMWPYLWAMMTKHTTMNTLTNLNGESTSPKRGVVYYLLTFVVVEVLFIGLLLLSHMSFAQGPGQPNEHTGTLLTFKVVFAGGNAYTKWYVQNEEDDGLFLVERSTDNENFKVIGAKQGIGVPSKLIIMYSYVDKDPKPGYVWYRIHKIYSDGSGYYSPTRRVEVPVAADQDLVVVK